MCHERWALHVVIKRKFFLHLFTRRGHVSTDQQKNFIGKNISRLVIGYIKVSNGRLGFHKTSERVRLNFFWPGMKQDIRSHTSSCEPCQFRARARRSDHVPITPVVRPTVPFVQLTLLLQKVIVGCYVWLMIVLDGQLYTCSRL